MPTTSDTKTDTQLGQEQSDDVGVPLQNHKLFGITELLIEVLNNLSMFDLLRAERVSKGFNNAIKTSRRLQVTLYRTPEEQTAGCKNMHPLLVEADTEYPIFDYSRGFSTSGWNFFDRHTPREVEEICLDSDIDVAEPGSLGRLQTGSWRDMLVRHPPYTWMDVKLKWRCGNAAGIVIDEYDAKQAHGLTFGRVIDRLLRRGGTLGGCWELEKDEDGTYYGEMTRVRIADGVSLEEMVEEAAEYLTGDPTDYTITHIIFAYKL